MTDPVRAMTRPQQLSAYLRTASRRKAWLTLAEIYAARLAQFYHLEVRDPVVDLLRAAADLRITPAELSVRLQPYQHTLENYTHLGVDDPLVRIVEDPGFIAGLEVHRDVPRRAVLAALDLFGNELVPPAFDPVWRTEAAVGIAAKMYEARDYAVMPILADALEDAGCGNPDIIAHCREPGVHIRGCWVIDQVLGKA